jgi:hypothetical protein
MKTNEFFIQRKRELYLDLPPHWLSQPHAHPRRQTNGKSQLNPPSQFSFSLSFEQNNEKPFVTILRVFPSSYLSLALFVQQDVETARFASIAVRFCGVFSYHSLPPDSR